MTDAKGFLHSNPKLSKVVLSALYLTLLIQLAFADCGPRCLECDAFDKDNCTTCQIEFYGDDCQGNCSSHCLGDPDTRRCAEYDGHCFGDCENGYWGPTCRNLCSPQPHIQCVGDVCNRNSGHCTNGCTIFGREGTDCTEHPELRPLILVFVLLPLAFIIIPIYCKYRRNKKKQQENAGPIQGYHNTGYSVEP